MLSKALSPLMGPGAPVQQEDYILVSQGGGGLIWHPPGKTVPLFPSSLRVQGRQLGGEEAPSLHARAETAP